jgi:hypothetical protein
VSAILLVFAALTAQAAVDPGLLNLVPPETKILTGIQVDSSLVSPFGKYVLGQIQFDDADFQKFVTETGFDPRRDLREILAATDSTGKTLVLGRGTFNTSRISGAAQTAGGAVKQYRGAEMLVHTHRDGATALVFLDSGTAVMGDEAMVRSAIDRRSGGATLTGALVTKAKAVSSNNHAWFATTSSPAEFLAGKVGDPNLSGAMQGNLMQAILEASGGMKFGTSAIQLFGEAVMRSEKDAQALVDVMKFLAGLVQTKSSDPRVGKIASLADAAKFSSEGNIMRLNMTLPEDMVEKLFMSVTKAKAAAVH